MDEFEERELRAEGASPLLGWTMCRTSRDSIVLGLRYATSPADADHREEVRVQLVLPLQAALYLSEELSRQARSILA
jgi:hypothetical protein